MISGSMDPIFPYANSQLVDYCLRCDGHHTKDKKTTVIGSGAGAAWVAIMLHERYAPPSMTVLTHGEQPQFDEETLFLMDEYNIKVKTGEITGVKGDAKEPRLEGFELENGEFCEAEFSFVSLGSIIYNELPKSLNVDIDKRGYIPTDKWGQTNIDGFFVAGDIRA
ncbi:MAG: NAD(P)/FAD-dependent oxidoreductase, partial [Halobacteriovoraceae bacterium]|nr:NAD(P)/FAD-dependent oxidoreductase [Halobacteriovoraceae bacterium]